MNRNFQTIVFAGRWLRWLLCGAAPFLLASSVRAPEPLLLEVDFRITNGVFRPLHGFNKGPQAAGGMITVTEAQHALRVPFTRLHDCHWPNPDVVDIHAIFPRPEADPHDIGSYDFALTDDYLQAIRQTGAKMIYRLGESIEHTRIKRFVHPPRDFGRWAEVCLGIIRHYNEGWAEGFRFQIPYWEIWNEPENRPAMWSGTDQDYVRLYKTTARKIKAAYPVLKVGGPAVGFSGQFRNGQFEPSAFVLAFLEMCARDKVPLDFFSWHCYTADPAEITARARSIRQLLDTKGFKGTESHLNEWNYLPGNSWKPLSTTGTPEMRERYFNEMSGPAAAAFIVTVLLELQDAPVDVCNLFHGELGGFGLFSENGVPFHNYFALLAFERLLESGQRAGTYGAIQSHVGLAAASQNESATILVSNYDSAQEEVRLEFTGFGGPSGSEYTILRLDSAHKLAQTSKGHASRELTFHCGASEVVLISLRPKPSKD